MALGKKLLLRDPNPPQNLSCPRGPVPPAPEILLSWLRHWGLERVALAEGLAQPSCPVLSPVYLLPERVKNEAQESKGLSLSPSQDFQLVTSESLLPALRGLRNPLLGYNSGDLTTVSRQLLLGNYDSAAAQR